MRVKGSNTVHYNLRRLIIIIIIISSSSSSSSSSSGSSSNVDKSSNFTLLCFLQQRLKTVFRHFESEEIKF
jgi:hypothetical protein